MSIIIEELNRKHNRKLFDCGSEQLNQFLKHQSRQNNVRNLSKTYVACQDSNPTTVIAYHTLTGYSVLTPPSCNIYKKHPHPLNAIKLARLAVNRSCQGQGLGEKLLIDAIYRTVLVSQQIAVIGLFADTITVDIIPFFQQYGFLPIESSDTSCIEMWLPIKTCIELVDALL